MLKHEVEVKVQNVVKNPKLSLKRFSQYTVATENAKARILKGCKYPNPYVPRFYEIARKLVCDLFAANFDDHNLYFEEFKKEAAILRNEAKDYPTNKDGYKNRIRSANGLEAIVAMSIHLKPILSQYTLNSNLKNNRDSITKNDVRIGAMADMLLSRNGGATQVGFIKFNFTAKKLKKEEAEASLSVLKTFFKKQEIELDMKSCLVVDVFAWRIYVGVENPEVERIIDKATQEISVQWGLI